jgi:curli production assembly/transport component CsgF
MKKQILAGSLSLVLGAWMLAGNVLAEELVYVPVNPNFGGNPFNAGPMQTNANSQNGFTDPNAPEPGVGLGFGSPEDTLNNLLQNQLAQSRLNTIVDPNGFFIVGRTLTTGTTTYAVTAGTGGTNQVTATNNATGAVSVFTVPAPPP